jgi:hypothetical protein
MKKIKMASIRHDSNNDIVGLFFKSKSEANGKRPTKKYGQPPPIIPESKTTGVNITLKIIPRILVPLLGAYSIDLW